MFSSKIFLIRRYLSTNLKRKPISSILIANRGEIACRVIKTARRIGVKTVAIYSEADLNALHVKQADEAYCVGPAPSSKSYLCGEKIIDIAKRANCQAIHPGYGFLSENVEFAEQCDRDGVIFVGPPASAIRDMGIKSTSKSIMAAAGVPIVNGYHGDDQSDEKLQTEAKKIGFPLMIKAVRGGGGKGMRIAESYSDFMNALNSARTESIKAFGDGSVLLERFISSPRHVEVQVFGDMHGNVVHLFERDCSVQRRHQKIIEEAPAPGLPEEIRAQLGAAAVCAAKAVNYVGAGTVEFILDKEDLSFHFMEMNTRLQVEHPITEMITGTDLVEWQIKVASGEPLPITQANVKRNGHAFEARIYAESPNEGFIPGAGTLTHLSVPESNDSVRIETGVLQGDEVSVHYDPMIAKLAVWGKTRSQALNSLIARLKDYHIDGLETNVNFLIELASHQSFRAADVHTGFIEQHYNTLFKKTNADKHTIAGAAMALILNEQNAVQCNNRSGNKHDAFNSCNSFRVNSNVERSIHINSNNKEHLIRLQRSGCEYNLKIDNGEWQKCAIIQSTEDRDDRLSLKLNLEGRILNLSAVISNDHVAIFGENGKTDFTLYRSDFLEKNQEGTIVDDSRIKSPMTGVYDKILVKLNDVIEADTPVAVIIAMKMEYVLKSTRKGTVISINPKVGQNVAKGEVIVTIE